MIPFLLDEEARRAGFKRLVSVDYQSGSPHVSWTGRSGSGKSVSAKVLLAKSILFVKPELQPVEVTVIDPKADTDFDFLEGCSRFYRGISSPQGLHDTFKAFERRQSREDTSRNLKIIFIDEFASLMNFLDSKQQKEEIHRILSLLLMLSRSYSFSLHCATQQSSAQTYGNSGNREQFGNVFLLGDAGAETQRMIFDSDSVEKIRKFGHIGGRGGWFSQNGGLVQAIRVPKVNKWSDLHAVIRKGVERNDS
jgi:hypothetical protein